MTSFSKPLEGMAFFLFWMAMDPTFPETDTWMCSSPKGDIDALWEKVPSLIKEKYTQRALFLVRAMGFTEAEFSTAIERNIDLVSNAA